MALKFDSNWRFDPPADRRYRNAAIPPAAVSEFAGLILTVANQAESPDIAGSRQDIMEHYKKRFCRVKGAFYASSSSEGWAEQDLERDAEHAADNAPLFIEALFDACEELRNRFPDWFIPDPALINRILAKHEVGYEIRPPFLVLREEAGPPVAVPDPPPSLDQRARKLLDSSLTRSEQLLTEGRLRESVQEMLWILETVTTSFRGVETPVGAVEGDYFNEIVRDLRAKHPKSILEQVLRWATTLHGYLSSPGGGGVRHGLDLRDGIELGPTEARLIINLIRSYLAFLLEEHERLARPRT